MSNPYLEESLLDYERKLEDALQLYKRRLDRFVWENLQKSKQDKYRFWLAKPLGYQVKG